MMALRIGVALGGTLIGAPIVGWVADHFGPRWALCGGAASGFAAAALAIRFLVGRSRWTQARPLADPPSG
jgi:MFS family permease